MNGMMLHCGSEEVTRKVVEMVPVPEHTDTWKPVPYGNAIEFLHEQAKERIGLPVVSERYGLNKDGAQLFALLVLGDKAKEGGLAMELRASYNKSLANGCAVGKNVFVCDNLMFSGDAFHVVRKNTVNVWRDFQHLLIMQLNRAFDYYKTIEEVTAGMKAKMCSMRRGFSMLGIAQGEGILTPT